LLARMLGKKGRAALPQFGGAPQHRLLPPSNASTIKAR